MGQVHYDTPIEITSVANASYDNIRNAAQIRFLNGSGLSLTQAPHNLGLTGNGTGVYVKEARLNSDKSGIWIALCEDVSGPIISHVLVDREARDANATRAYLSSQQWSLYDSYNEAKKAGSAFFLKGREITTLARRVGTSFNSTSDWLNSSGERIGVQHFSLGIANVLPKTKLYVQEAHLDGEGRGVWLGLRTPKVPSEKVESYVLVSESGTKENALLARWPVPPPFTNHQLNLYRAYTEARESGAVVYAEPLDISGVVRRSNGLAGDGFLNADGVPVTQGSALGVSKQEKVFVKEARVERGSEDVWLGLTVDRSGPILSYALIDSEATNSDAIKRTLTPLQFNLQQVYDDAKQHGSITYNPPHFIPDPYGESGLTRESFLGSTGKTLGAVFGIGLQKFSARTEVTKAVFLEPDRIVLSITGTNVAGSSKSTTVVIHPDKIVHSNLKDADVPLQLLRGKVLDRFVGYLFALKGAPYLRDPVFESFRGSFTSYQWSEMLSVLRGGSAPTTVMVGSSTVAAGPLLSALEGLEQLLRG